MNLQQGSKRHRVAVCLIFLLVLQTCNCESSRMQGLIISLLWTRQDTLLLKIKSQGFSLTHPLTHTNELYPYCSHLRLLPLRTLQEATIVLVLFIMQVNPHHSYRKKMRSTNKTTWVSLQFQPAIWAHYCRLKQLLKFKQQAIRQDAWNVCYWRTQCFLMQTTTLQTESCAHLFSFM